MYDIEDILSKESMKFMEGVVRAHGYEKFMNQEEPNVEAAKAVKHIITLAWGLAVNEGKEEMMREVWSDFLSLTYKDSDHPIVVGVTDHINKYFN